MVDVERVQADPSLQVIVSGGRANDGVSVYPGTKVDFWVTSPPTSDGFAIPVTGRRWRFVPDSGAPKDYYVGSKSAANGDYFTRSGTMSVEGDANGYTRPLSARVEVAKLALVVSANRQVVTPGDTVVLTIKEKYGAGVFNPGFYWRADGGSYSSVAGRCRNLNNAMYVWECRVAVTSPGMFWATGQLGNYSTGSQDSLRLYAGPARLKISGPSYVGEGQTATFAATVMGGPASLLTVQGWSFRDSSGNAVSACGAGQTTCTRAISSSGWMIVSGTIAGAAARDSTYIVAVPCPTGDPLLDDPGMRTFFMGELNAGGIGLPPDQRHERGGWIFQAADGRRFTSPPVIGNPCNVSLGIKPTPPPGATLVGRYHLHVVSEGETQTGCIEAYGHGSVANGTFVLDSVAPRPPFPAPPEPYGTDGDNYLVDPGVPHYVVTAEGEIYRMDHPTPASPSTTPVPANRIWRWDRGPGNACTWKP